MGRVDFNPLGLSPAGLDVRDGVVEYGEVGNKFVIVLGKKALKIVRADEEGVKVEDWWIFARLKHLTLGLCNSVDKTGATH